MSVGSGLEARHIRGEAEKIWKVLPPTRWASRPEFSRDLEREVWMPIRKQRL